MEKRRGGQPGNQNAKGNRGGHAPLNNRNAWKHGGYSSRCPDEDEVELSGDRYTDPEDLLSEEIFLYTIRERRLLQMVNMYADQLCIERIMQQEHQREFDDAADEQKYKQIREDRMPGRDAIITTMAINRDDAVLKIERELTSLQAKKGKAIEALARYKMEKAGQEQEDSFVRLWADAVMKSKE